MNIDLNERLKKSMIYQQLEEKCNEKGQHERTWQSDAPASSSRKSVQAAAAKSKTKAKASAAKAHKIKNGESLSSISKKYGVSIAELKRANGMTNDKLRAGKTLKIPAKSKTGSKKSTKKRSRR